MNDMRWVDGEVQVEDSVRAERPLSGEALQDGFFEAAAELCAAVRYLSSDEARFAVGTTLILDGGFTAM